MVYELPFITKNKKIKTSVAISHIELYEHGGIAGLKYILILMYFRKHLQTFGEVELTIEKLAEDCGYSTRTHNQHSFDDFRNVLQKDFIDKGYITTDVDVLSIGARKHFSIFLSEDHNLFCREDRYVLFTIAEYEIISSLNKKVNRSVLAGVYLFIKKYITTDDENKYGTKIAYPSKKTIMNGLQLGSVSIIESAIKTLIDLHMIYAANDLYVQIKNGANTYVPARSVFALKEKDLDVTTCISELTAFYGREVLRKSDIPVEQRKFMKRGGTN